jgi:WD40 repeat protein
MDKVYLPLRDEAEQALGCWRLTGHTNDVHFVAFSPDGLTAFSASDDGTLRVWDTQTRKERHCFKGHKGLVRGASLSANGDLLLSAGQDGTLRLWEVRTGKELRVFQVGAAHRVAFSPDGSRALLGRYAGLIQQCETDKELRRFTEKRGVQSVDFSPDGLTALVAGGEEGAANQAILSLWDLDKGQELRRFDEPRSKGICRAIFSPDGKQVLSTDGSLGGGGDVFGGGMSNGAEAPATVLATTFLNNQADGGAGSVAGGEGVEGTDSAELLTWIFANEDSPRDEDTSEEVTLL